MKKLLLVAILITSIYLTFGCSKRLDINAKLASGTWVDLTHDFSEDTIYWPTSEKFMIKPVFTGHTEHGYYYEAYKFCCAEHGGTHSDAPIHFAEGKKSIDQVSLKQLIGEAIVIDVSKKCLSNPDYQATIEDIKLWEKKNGKIPSNSILFLYTGYSKFWGNEKKYLGTTKRGEEGVKELHFPSIHPDAAQWLVANRGIKAFGLDTASIDYGQSKLYEVHQALFKNDIIAFENVANLDKLPPKGSLVIALPMKIKDGSGGPTRIIARLPD